MEEKTQIQVIPLSFPRLPQAQSDAIVIPLVSPPSRFSTISHPATRRRRCRTTNGLHITARIALSLSQSEGALVLSVLRPLRHPFNYIPQLAEVSL